MKKNTEVFKFSAQIAFHSKVGMFTNLTIRNHINSCLYKQRRNILVHKHADSKYTPPILCASYIYSNYPSRGGVILLDPYMLLERRDAINTENTYAILIYGMDLLGSMDNYNAHLFFSTVKWLLIQNVRCIMPIDCGYDRASMDKYFKNKQVVDTLKESLSDTRYCMTLGV